MKILIVSLIFLSFFNPKIIAQEQQSKIFSINRNSIYSNLGFGFLSLSATVYYDGLSKKYEYFTTFYKIGIGASTTFFDGEFHLLGQYGILTGCKNHHLELGIGPNLQLVNILTGKPYLPITSTVGWRVQKPEGNFIFRTGLSWPEGIYLGFGYSF